MKTQMQLHTIRNRSRRIPRRLEELTNDRQAEIISAARLGREPRLGDIELQILRLNARKAELNAKN